jgi:hypothetical protein
MGVDVEEYEDGFAFEGKKQIKRCAYKKHLMIIG